MTLLLKDRHFHHFLVDSLNAENICRATNDTSIMTYSYDNCYWYRELTPRDGSKCTYDTPRTDNGRQSYRECLTYRIMKSLGADSVCEDRVTLVYMCHLFGFTKKWLQERGVSADIAIVSDSDTTIQRKNMFSDADCKSYQYMKWFAHSSRCEYNSLLYVTSPGSVYTLKFTDCITLHFMTEMGASDTCYDDSVRSHIDTTVQNTNTLLSKDRHFYNFMVHTLDAGNVCEAVKDTATFPADDCAWYISIVKDHHYDTRCEHNPQRTDTDNELPYDECLEYRLMKSLGAGSVCQLSLIENCDWYHNMMQSLAPTCICVIGLIGNVLSLCMFGSGAIETSIAYQLLWLAGVDITFILTWWVVEVLPNLLLYYNEIYYLTPFQTSIVSVLTVCLRPLSYVTRSCTVWLTVLIGLYCYLAVCHPYNKLTSHCTQHGQKYVILVVFLSFLYNIPYFCEYNIDYMYTLFSYVYDYVDFSASTYYSDHYDDRHPHGFYALLRTGLVSKELLHIYSRIHAAVIVSLPCLILFFVTLSILVELRKLKKKGYNMQVSPTSQNFITVRLVTILITFIVCQLPFFV